MTESRVPEPAAKGEVTVHVLRAAPPTRALLVAALGSVLGAVLLVLSKAQDWSVVVTVLGVIVLVAGLLLGGLAIWTMTKMQVRAELTPRGYLFRTPAGTREGTWAETTKLTASESGRRLTLHRADESVVNVLSPVGSQDPAMKRLIADLTRWLSERR